MATSCPGLSVTGPFKQTLFLGCSVVDFSTSLGWNGSPSELTVRLVYDPCVGGERVYWDENLIKKTTTAKDPGFIGQIYDPATGEVIGWNDIIGCTAYFRVGDFEYTGLIQHWEEENSSSGHPTYSVQLMDPRQLLENSKLIIGEYAGNVGGISNVFNVFGVMERYGQVIVSRSPEPNLSSIPPVICNPPDCPIVSLINPDVGYVFTPAIFDANNILLNGNLMGIDGPTFGSPATKFGGANTNHSGMPWYAILNGINLLANQIPAFKSQWAPYGRMVYKGLNFGGYGLLPGDNFYMDGNVFTGFTKKYLSEYFIDLSDLPTPPPYWRVNNTHTDILSVVDQLCKDAGYDYYIELIPVRSNYGGIAKFIKIRTVRRFAQPILGTISTFIKDGDGSISAKRGVELRNETTSAICIGGPKNTLCQGTIYDGVGNNHETEEGKPNIDNILPYFGIYPWDKNVIMPFKEKVYRTNSSIVNEKLASTGQTTDDNCNLYEWYFWAETTYINSRFTVLSDDGNNGLNILDNKCLGGDGHTLTPPSPIRLAIKITEIELMCALAGFDVWLSCAYALNTDTGKYLTNSYIANGLYNLADSIDAIVKAKDDAKLDPKTMFPANPSTLYKQLKIENTAMDEIQALFNFVGGFALMLGKQFQMRVPYTCGKLDFDTGQVVTSEEPTSSGWTEQPHICGLPTNTLYSQFMRTDDNRYNAMIVFDDNWTPIVNPTAPTIKKDVTKLDDSDYIFYGDRIYVKAQVQSEYVYGDYTNRLNPRAVLTIGNPVRVATDTLLPNLRASIELLSRTLANIDAPPKIKALDSTKRAKAMTKVAASFTDGGGGLSFTAPLPYHCDTNPIGACCGIKSNIMVYGPWFNVGPVGGVKIDSDPGLVPWEYNGYNLMNYAGQSKANEGVTRMQVGEMGDITVPGYPIIPLGAELGAYANGISGVMGGGSQLLENRSHDVNTYQGSNNFSTQCAVLKTNVTDKNGNKFDGRWTGMYGPNITSIAVSVNNGVQTSYKMRTYSPKFGRFSKATIDKIKTMGQNQIRSQKKFMDTIGKTMIGNTTKVLNSARLDIKTVYGETQSPHALLIGVHQGTIQNPGIHNCYSLSERDLINDLNNWEEKGIMSLDGLLRPVSLSPGGGYLPGSTQPRLLGGQPASDIPSTTRNPQPPIADANAYNLSIYNGEIHPWQTPEVNGGLAIRRAPGSNPGNAHDIHILGGDIDKFHVIGADYGPSGNYENERGMALKGPLLLHGWGYDTESKPIPNSADNISDTTNGIFTSVNLTDNFMSDFLRKPMSWPVAPVDLRFDRERGVWTIPPSYTMLVGRLTTPIDKNTRTGVAVITQGPPIYNSDGDEMTSPQVKVTDYLSKSYPTGTNVILYYNTKLNTYNIVESSVSSPTIISATAVVSNGTITSISNPLSFDGSPIGTTITDVEQVGTGYGTYNGAVGTLVWNQNVSKWRPIDFPCSI